MRSSFLSSHFSKGFCTDLFLIANAGILEYFQILDFSLKKERPSPHTGPPQKIKRRRRRRLQTTASRLEGSRARAAYLSSSASSTCTDRRSFLDPMST